MNSFVVFACLLAAASASPQLLAYNNWWGPAALTSQYHAQDELGQYSYGYSGGPSSKQEVRTADGITRGAYSYIDGHGLVQSASYVSDPVNGFRVAATNLPHGPAPVHAAPIVAPVHAAPIAVAAPGVIAAPAETPEVIAAKAAHFAAHGEALYRLSRGKRSLAFAAPLAIAPARSFAYSTVAAHSPIIAAAPYATPLAYSAHHLAAPAIATPWAAAPAVHPLAAQSQYHAQDELGQYSYGYNNINSAKHESKTFDGITRGGYSYVDSHGLVQNVNYVADAAGFRVAATNLPVGPA